MVQSYSVGAYRMAYTIGVGTFGRVKLATHEKTGQKVAIKIINRARMQSMEMHEKVLREISILQKLGAHPHIVRLYELLDTPTDIFMVMEYVPGGELFDYIVQRSRLTEGEARVFFQQIVSGVEYCHHHLICHRDLKPENVFLESDTSVKVGDFGLSNFMRDGDFLKTSCGSPNYAAPEVVSGKAYAGPEVDVWSCGVILYALLCGSLPFDDEHVPNLFKKIKRGNFNLPGHLSDNARRLLMRMLLVDPGARISLKEIRRHPWTRENSPVPMPVWRPDPFQVDECILVKLKQMGYTLERKDVIKHQVSNDPILVPKEIIAYNLLVDQKRADVRSSRGGYPDDCQLQPSSKKLPFAFCREIKRRHLTAALFQVDYTPLGFVSFTASRDLFGIDSQHVSQSSATVSTRRSSNSVDGNSGYTFSGVSRLPSRSSIVSSLHNSDSPKWKPGIESSLDSATIMTAVFHTLRSIGFEWHIVSQHRIWCRPREPASRSPSLDPSPLVEMGPRYPDTTIPESSTDDKVILCIQVFRVPGGKGAVNIQVFDGSLATGMRCALSTLFAIYRTLAQTQQQSAGVSESRRKDGKDLDERLDAQLREAEALAPRAALDRPERQTIQTLEATLENLTFSNQQLETDNARLTVALRDSVLQRETELVAREAKIYEQELEMTLLKLSYAQSAEDGVQNLELKDAVSQLTQLYLKGSAKLAVCEKELHTKTSQVESGSAGVVRLSQALGESRGVCEALREALITTEEIVATQEELNLKLEADVSRLTMEVREMMEAVTISSQTLSQERELMAEKVKDLLESNRELNARVQKMAPQLKPTWAREEAERKQTRQVGERVFSVVNGQRAYEMSCFEELAAILLEYEELVGRSSSAGNKFYWFRKTLMSLARIRRLKLLLMATIRYIHGEYVAAWLQHAKENRKSLTKDRNSILWCHQIIKDYSDCLFWVSRLMTASCVSEAKPKTSYAAEVFQLEEFEIAIGAAEHCAGMIFQSLVNGTISTVITSQQVAHFSSAIRNILGQNRAPDEPVAPPVAACPATVVTAALFRVVFGLLLTLVVEDTSNLPDHAFDEVYSVFAAVSEEILAAWKESEEVTLQPKLKTAECLSIVTSVAIIDDKKFFSKLTEALSKIEGATGVADEAELWSISKGVMIGDNETIVNSFFQLNVDSIQNICGSVRDVVGLLKTSNIQPHVSFDFCVASPDAEEGPEREAHSASTDLRKEESQSLRETEQVIPPSRELESLMNENTILKSRLEVFKLKEKEFARAGASGAKLVEEIAKKSLIVAQLVETSNSNKNQVKQLHDKLRSTEKALQESDHLRKSRNALPPSLASFELARMRGVLTHMQSLLLERDRVQTSANWLAVEDALDSSAQTAPPRAEGDLHLSERLKLRERLVNLALENPGLAALSSQTGAKLPVPEKIIDAQVTLQKKKFNLSQDWHALGALERQPIASDCVRQVPDETILLARAFVGAGERGGRIFMGVQETAAWLKNALLV